MTLLLLLPLFLSALLGAVTELHGHVVPRTTPRAPRYKVVVMGESAVGKSSIASRFVRNSFAERPESTVGAAFMSKMWYTGGRIVTFELWDTAGQERYNSLAPIYYRDARAALVVYDITNRASFDRAIKWVQQLWTEPSVVLIVLVGNKLDLEEHRQVSYEEASAFAAEQSLFFFEASAKTGENIEGIFDLMGQKLMQHDEESLPGRIIAPVLSWDASDIINLVESQQSRRGYCC